DAFENKQYKPKDTLELFRDLFNDVQSIREELAEYINTPGWNRPAFCSNGDDDDEDYTIAVTSDFLITDSLSMGDEHLDTIPEKELDEFNKSSVEDFVPNRSESEDFSDIKITSDFLITDSLSMGDEHLDTIPEKESDEFNKSSVEDLFPNPSESEDFSDIESECDMPDCDDSQTTHFSTFFNPFFDNSTSSDEEIDSLLADFAGALIFLESIPPGVDETNCDPKEDIHLVERLPYDNSSPRPPEEFVFENSDAEIESFSPSPIPIEDSDSFMEEIDLFLTPDDPMPPSIEDDEDFEGDILFERLLHDDPIPLPDTLDFSYEVRIFLPFFTYPVTSPVLLSFGSEDKIFDPGITVNRSYSFYPGLSHRCGTFKKFNTHRSYLNKSPMEMLFSTYSPMD
nr:hypothetical protein [Tanacetum cinerariifolium]